MRKRERQRERERALAPRNEPRRCSGERRLQKMIEETFFFFRCCESTQTRADSAATGPAGPAGRLGFDVVGRFLEQGPCNQHNINNNKNIGWRGCVLRVPASGTKSDVAFLVVFLPGSYVFFETPVSTFRSCPRSVGASSKSRVLPD